MILDFSVLKECGSGTELFDETQRLTRVMGFELWAYAAKVYTPSGDLVDWSMHNFPDSMWASYCAADPIPACSRMQLVPRIWVLDADSLRQGCGDLDADRLYSCVHQHGVTGGICIPIHDFGDAGTLTLATRRRSVVETWLQQIAGTALLFSRYLHEACLRRVRDQQSKALPRLSQREVECLTWASKGKTTWEISRLLSISEHTVNFHLRNANSKLGVVNRRQAVAKSIQLGMLLT